MTVSNQSRKFEYNDLVQILDGAPKKLGPNQIGCICGYDFIDDSKAANFFQCPTNTWVYTVEYGDGSSQEIPEIFLKSGRRNDFV